MAEEWICPECNKVFPKLEIPIRNKDMLPVCPDCGTPVACIDDSLKPEITGVPF